MCVCPEGRIPCLMSSAKSLPTWCSDSSLFHHPASYSVSSECHPLTRPVGPTKLNFLCARQNHSLDSEWSLQKTHRLWQIDLFCPYSSAFTIVYKRQTSKQNTRSLSMPSQFRMLTKFDPCCLVCFVYVQERAFISENTFPWKFVHILWITAELQRRIWLYLFILLLVM